MKKVSATAAILGFAAASACGSGQPETTDFASGGSFAGSAGGIGGGGSAGGQAGSGLAALSIAEAPEATRTFFWGTIDVAAPGFVGPPRDELTIALGQDNSLRYLSWKTLPMLPKTFGDGAGDFPLSGSRAVDLRPDINDDYTATITDAPAPTPTHFWLRYRVVSRSGQCDFVESTEGTRSGSGWSVTYGDEGTLWGAAISAHGQGMLYPGVPNAPTPAPGQPTLWSAPVELVAPGFYGPPVDHLTVSLDGRGGLRWFSFDRFARGVSFTGSADELEPGKGTIADEGDVTFDNVVPPTPSHFVIRYTVHSTEKLNDYTEGLDGTRQGNALIIRYFFSGKLWGAALNAHAAGTLVPASPSPSTTGVGGSGGFGAGGAGGSGGYMTLP